MSEQLLEEVVGDGDHSFADNEYIRDWFIDVGREYVANADDPTTEQVATCTTNSQTQRFLPGLSDT
jgi:hypothetical protein